MADDDRFLLTFVGSVAAGLTAAGIFRWLFRDRPAPAPTAPERVGDLERLRTLYSEDLRRFGYLGTVSGFDAESIYLNYLALYAQYTGGGFP